MTLEELVLEWSYLTPKGYPDMGNPSDVLILEKLLSKLNLPSKDIIKELKEQKNWVDKDGKPETTDGMEDSPVEKSKTDTTFNTSYSYSSPSDISVDDIINILPKIKSDQEALLKIKKYIINRKGEVGFFDKLTLKNINDATIDSSNAPKDLFQILVDNDDVDNYDVFDQPSFSELGKSGNIFDFYSKNSDLSRNTILKLFDYFGTEGGRGVGKGEMAFALLFNDVKMASGAGDLDWAGRYLEVKGSNARLGKRDRKFEGFERTSLGKLAQKYDKTDKNLITLIINLSDEVDIDLNELLNATIDFENEAHPLGNANGYFNLDNIKDFNGLRKAFLKTYIDNYSREHKLSHFIWWNSQVHGGKSATPGEAKTKWGTYVIFTPEEAETLVEDGTILTGMPSLHNLDPVTTRP